ncbi:hypothetical protein VH1709_contig00167-0008 [Vibrio harveyi]|uniref:hypothetical protein n=1 Tax=Vibrio harveyi TaxID=669 RepID=UPI000D78B1B7|nr:hypothetical protein [Vibrio harveyi]GBL02623.1 hypothetical protein VH1709_contig00167-0008 [Vibrio harveyi]
MFKGFNVTLESLESLNHTTNYKSQLKQNKEYIQDSLEKFLLSDGSIDGEKLRQEWFPNFKDTHVFISHSHKDLELAEGLASWLYDQFKISSFIDSHVWGYANDLLKKLDNKYALFPQSESYSYEIRNETTSHVHMMLSSALNEVIDSTECLLFLNTNNAINNIALSGETDDHRTASPWIMSELVTSSIIRRKENVFRKKVITEAIGKSVSIEDIEGMEQLVIQHKAPINHLPTLTSKSLKMWEEAKDEIGYKPVQYNALTALYNLFGGEKYIVAESHERELEVTK